MKNLLIFLLILLGVQAGAQVYQEDTTKYMKNPNAYPSQSPGYWSTKIMRLPDTTNNRPQIGVPGAVGRNTAGTEIFTWDGDEWVRGSGGVEIDSVFVSSIDSIFITSSDSIFIVSGNDTIFVGESDQIRDTAKLTAGFGIYIISPSLNDSIGFYGPNYDDRVVSIDTASLVTYLNNYYTNIVNYPDSASFTYIVYSIDGTPNFSYDNGTKVLVADAGTTGVFVGHENDIATLIGGVYNFVDPVSGNQLIVSNDSDPDNVIFQAYRYNGLDWIRQAIPELVGGQTLGVTNTFGTNDTQGLILKTNDRGRLRIASNGDIYMPKFKDIPANNFAKWDSATGRLTNDVFRQLVAGTNITITSGANTDTINSTGGGGSQTWQQTLDVGSDLDKDNEVDADNHYFLMNNLSFAQFVGKDVGNPDYSGLLSVNANGISMSGNKTTFGTQITSSNDSAFIEANNIDGSDIWQNYMSMTDNYTRFDRKLVTGSPTFSPYPKIFYAPEVMETEPDYVYVSDNDTIKKYPYSSGGASVNVYEPLVKSNDSISLRFTVKQSGDGIYDTTGAITSSDATLTAVNSVFASGDVGKVIVVIGAGTSGRDLVTTIASFTSATSVELTANAATTVSSNAKFIFGTDRTAAIQATINACYAAGGGTVHLNNGIYIIAGALQTSVGGLNMNSQIYIPADSSKSLNKTHIIIEGETPPNYTQYGALNSLNLNSYKGTVLVSTLATGATGAAVIGTKGYTGAGGTTFNYNYLSVKNITIKVLDNPAGAGPVVGGISYKNGASLIADQVQVIPIGAGGTSVMPTNDVTGIETPDFSSETMSYITNTLTGGFRFGYKIGEHSDLDQAQAFVCYYGLAVKQGSHNIKVGRFCSQWCTNDIYNIQGTIPPTIKFDELDVEYMTAGYSGGKWYDNLNTINDSLNQIRGIAFFSLVSAGVGRDNTHLTKNGGTNFSTYAIGDSTSFARLNGNNTYSAPSTNTLTQTFNAVSNSTNMLSWGKSSQQYYKLSLNENGDGAYDLRLRNLKTGTDKIFLDTAGVISIGGAASSPATSGLSINNAATILYIPTAKVGIGTNNPSLVAGSSNAFLEISGSTNPGFALRNTTGSRQYFFYVGSSGSNQFSIFDATGGDDRFMINSAGAIRFPAYGAGTLTTDASGNITATSDERVKNSINPYRIGLKAIMNVHPSTYKRNATGDYLYAGFIAQDIQKAFGGLGVGKNNDGMLTLDRDVILAGLVNAIQEQQKEIEELKSEINRLKK